MQTLERRIEALEQSSPRGDGVMFIILVGMGEVDKEVVHIYDNHGNHWDRLPHETEEGFKGRATSETPRKEKQVAMLFGKVSRVEAQF